MATGSAQLQSSARSSTRAPVKAQRQLFRDEAEVTHLQRNVQQQESDNKRASERLQQQDKTIAKLQKELQELQSSQSSGQP